MLAVLKSTKRVEKPIIKFISYEIFYIIKTFKQNVKAQEMESVVLP